MKLGDTNNTVNCELDLMQPALYSWLDKKGIMFSIEHRASYTNTKEKVAFSRIADFLVVTDGRLINIEAKCNNTKEVILQLKDHALYCDYCFAYLPSYALTPFKFKYDLLRANYGLIIYDYNTGAIVEALEGHYNKPPLKGLRKKVKEEVKNRNTRQNKLQF